MVTGFGSDYGDSYSMTSEDRLRAALTSIATSGADNPHVLRHMAARALYGAQKLTLEGTLESLEDAKVKTNNQAQEFAAKIDTTKRMILDNATLYEVPHFCIYTPNGSVSLEWVTPDRKIILIVGVNSYEFIKLVDDRIMVHRAYTSYTGGHLNADVAKYLPLKEAINVLVPQASP